MSEAKGQHVLAGQSRLGSGDFSGRHPRRAFTRAPLMRFDSSIRPSIRPDVNMWALRLDVPADIHFMSCQQWSSFPNCQRSGHGVETFDNGPFLRSEKQFTGPLMCLIGGTCEDIQYRLSMKFSLTIDI